MAVYYLTALLAVTLFSACELSRQATPDARDLTVEVPTGDERLIRARAQARQTIEVFLVALDSREDGQIFGVKTPVLTDPGLSGPWVEHLWVTVSFFDGELFHGQLDSAPEWLPELRAGQPVVVHRNDVVDWMFTRDGLIYGGFTTRVLYQLQEPRDWPNWRQFFAPLPPESIHAANGPRGSLDATPTSARARASH